MKTLKIGSSTVNPLGMGCMGMSHGYGKPMKEDCVRTLHTALDIGYNFFDTAALYGFGENEKLIVQTLSSRRNAFVLASKCGLIRGPDGKRFQDASPARIRQTCEESLTNLRTDRIDLYYLHRVDPKIPLEDQIGTLADLIQEGKILSIGLSEVSVSTLKRAQAIHPIAALQSEYSLWTRHPEDNIIPTCKELGVIFVAFSPLGRGFLTGKLQDNKSLSAGDLRISMPRFSDEHFSSNLTLLGTLEEIAQSRSSSLAQIALAWILTKHPQLAVIPGTTNSAHALENFQAQHLVLEQSVINRLDKAFSVEKIHGKRYDQATLSTMETE